MFHQINISDMAAVEAALMHRPEASVTVLTMGTAAVIPLLKDLLARGVDEAVLLTDKGMEIADRIYTRHKVLTDFFKKLGVDEATAREDACKVEHDLSEETFHALRTHIEEMR